jgi:HD superfamily phosphodiesterase
MTGIAIQSMIRFFDGDLRRISHALKVFAYANAISELEGCSSEVTERVLLASIFHDVGIKIAEDKFGSCSMRQQEEEGPSAARAILESLGIEEKLIDGICFIIGHHHHPESTEDQAFRILIESDFIVNFEEGDLPLNSLERTVQKHFRTQSGIALAHRLFCSKK